VECHRNSIAVEHHYRAGKSLDLISACFSFKIHLDYVDRQIIIDEGPKVYCQIVFNAVINYVD